MSPSILPSLNVVGIAVRTVVSTDDGVAAVDVAIVSIVIVVADFSVGTTLHVNRRY